MTQQIATELRKLASKGSLEAAAKQLGLHYHWGKTRMFPRMEEGRGYAVHGVGELAHEMAHRMLAPKKRRDAPYFGLGSGNAPAMVKERLADREDMLAEILAWAILIRHGFQTEMAKQMRNQLMTKRQATAGLKALLAKALVSADEAELIQTRIPDMRY